MLQSIEAIVDHNGALRILEPITLPRFRRVIITILEDESEDHANLAEMSEIVLAADWERPEEEQAWLHLAQLPSL